MPIKPNAVQDRHVIALKALIHLLCLGLLARAYYLGFSDQLGGDPVKAIIHYTGIGALNLLLLTLSVTPLSRLLKQARLLRLRRLLGLYCFAWALAHLVNFALFDVQMDVDLLLTELTKRPYIVVGMCAFVILLALALTSIPAAMRAMGRRWKTLHRLVYLAALCVCVHFYWSVKADVTEPVLYFLALFLLLALRVPIARRKHTAS